MHALEFETIIDRDHEIHLKLPQDAREGRARVIVLYEEIGRAKVPGDLDDFLDALPLNPSGRSHADILQQVQEERDSWGSEP